MKAVVPAFNQEKALVGAFSVITNLRMELFEALLTNQHRILNVGSAGWYGGQDEQPGSLQRQPLWQQGGALRQTQAPRLPGRQER